MLSSTTLAVITSSTEVIGPALAIERATLASRMIWNTARPAEDAEAELVGDDQQPEGDHGDDAQRPRVLRASGRRLFSASLALTRATELPIIRKLSVPRPRPMQAPRPSSG